MTKAFSVVLSVSEEMHVSVHVFTQDPNEFGNKAFHEHKTMHVLVINKAQLLQHESWLLLPDPPGPFLTAVMDEMSKHLEENYLVDS